jgi:trehalose 6-phosphate synthase/phosphatase
MTATKRLLTVSNRLPVTAKPEGSGVQLTEASGGLATGVGSWHREAEGLWIGWPGDVSRFTGAQRTSLEQALRERRVVPVYLSQEEVERYYDGYSNRVLWPLFHYLVDRVPLEARGWDAYRRANEKFADAVAEVWQPGDAIWVHDYQLMLVPALIRERLPEARIGFFLHIPFPSSEVFRILPSRQEILKGLLGADLIGFHTFSYLRHFVTSLLHVAGVETQVDRIQLDGREVRLGVFPMGVDAAHFGGLAEDPQVREHVEAIRRDAGGRRIVLGVDRLDYTKGIPRRLLALERLLQRHEALRDSMRYIQVAVPSREKVDSYQVFRRQVEEAVGRINGSSSTIRSTPIHYIHRSVSQQELVALYCAADVMLVTPLRDGMNLVSKEFVASRVDGDGVLVLSEFAGVVAELGEALVVNPYDVEAVADAVHRALTMKEEERRVRMRSLRRRVVERDVHRWADLFVTRLFDTGAAGATPAEAREPLPARLERLRDSDRLAILLDYDGTLVPIAQSPELAVPDAELLSLLEALTSRPSTELHIVSGRPGDVLESWFGHLPITLWAEHGIYRRAPGGDGWESTVAVPDDWMDRLLPILEQFTVDTPGSLLERKRASVAWHYRLADPQFGVRQAHELRLLLGDALSNQPLEVLEGKKVIEVRLRGVSKAVVAHYLLAQSGDRVPAILALGDDRTDEDLFQALPDSAVTISVGGNTRRAVYRVADSQAVRELLRGFVVSPASA